MDKKGIPWKDVENDGKRTTCTWDVGKLSPRKKQRNRGKRFRELAEEGKQARTQGSGSWNRQPENTWSKCNAACHDTDCNEPLVKKGFTASKNENWEEFQDSFRRKMNATEWAFERIKEAFELDEARKVSIVHEIMFKKH